MNTTDASFQPVLGEAEGAKMSNLLWAKMAADAY